MAVGVNGGGPIEDMKVEVGEVWVVVELGFKEAKEGLGSEWRLDMGLEEDEEAIVV